jgi:hypothetical protein
MGIRHLQSLPIGDVVPLRSTRTVAVDATPPPEPVRLYHLITLAFLVHAPLPDQSCSSCGAAWPCPQVRLAYRLREGF